MRIAYIDCFAGVSGDMLVGALIDSGVSLAEIGNEIQKLKLPVSIATKKITKNGIAATQFIVNFPADQPERTLSDIYSIIDVSELDDPLKQGLKEVFKELAEVEGRIHNISPEQVHFHELGAVDTIVDITAAIVGFKKLGVDAVFCSAVPINVQGTVAAAHGLLPLPAPAALELLKNIPVYGKESATELVTPTGALLLKTLVKEFGRMPQGRIEGIGYGAGTHEGSLLRLMTGEAEVQDLQSTALIETNIDDLNPQFYATLMDALFAAGALDVWWTPIQMKKNRPGIKVSVICEKDDVEKLAQVIFSQTTTFGLRVSETGRIVLDRESTNVQTAYGTVRMKIGSYHGRTMSVSPEYEDCRRLAEQQRIPVKQVYDAAKMAYQNTQL